MSKTIGKSKTPGESETPKTPGEFSDSPDLPSCIEDLPFFTRPHTLKELVPEEKRHRFNAKEVKRGIYSPELLDYLIHHHPDVKVLTERKGREMFLNTILRSGVFNDESRESVDLEKMLGAFALPEKNFLMPQCIGSRPISDKSWNKKLKTMAHTLYFQQLPKDPSGCRDFMVHPYHSGDMFIRAVWLTTSTYTKLSSDRQGIIRRNYHKTDGYRIHRETVKLIDKHIYLEGTLDPKCQSKTVDVYVEERGPKDVVLHLSKTHWGDLVNYGPFYWDLSLIVVCNQCGHETGAHIMMSHKYRHCHNVFYEKDSKKRKTKIHQMFCDHLRYSPLNYAWMQCLKS